MSEVFNIWENEDKLVAESYKKDNFLVKENMKASTDICYIFFSSNGIYYPDVKEKFYEAIVKNDRYEWENICDNYFIKKKIRKFIFVRDIYKQYYIKGINKKIDSVDELVRLLTELTRGLSIVTIGTSSGGYMAALVGSKMHALYVLDFAGQFILNKERGKFVRDAIENKYQYIDITNLIETSNVPIFYFLPSDNETDCAQYENVKDISNVFAFLLVEKRHGIPISIIDVPGVLLNSKCEMEKLYEKCKGKKISRIRFHFKEKKFLISLMFSIRMVLKMIKRSFVVWRDST